MFKFNITLDDNDYFEYNKYHFLNSPTGKKTLMLYRLFLPIIFLLILFIFLINGFDFVILMVQFILSAILSTTWIVFAKKNYFSNLKKNIQKLKMSGKLPFSKENILSFDEELIIQTTPENESKIKYLMVERIVEAEKAVYIFISSIQGIIIPLSAFSDDSERKQFIEFIEIKIKERTQKP